MRQIILHIIIGILLFLPAACSTGSASGESRSLYPYLETDKLLELTQYPDPEIRIIDVRSAEAYAKGHIPTAVNIPSAEIMKRLKELKKSQYLIFYCESGGQAHRVMEQLKDKGYTRMLNWGAFSRWPYASSSTIQSSGI